MADKGLKSNVVGPFGGTMLHPAGSSAGGFPRRDDHPRVGAHMAKHEHPL
jgi:hypothetical protein